MQKVCCEYCVHRFDGEHDENQCDILLEKAKWLVPMTVELNWFCANFCAKGEADGQTSDGN